MDSFFKVFNLCVRTFITGSADVFNCIAEMIIQLLVSYEVPNLYASSGVVSRGRLGHFLTKLVTVFVRQKFCRCSAKKTVMMSALSASLRRSSSCLSLNSCSIVSSTTGGGGKPWYDSFGKCIIISTCKNFC